jgi:hypothetical protein
MSLACRILPLAALALWACSGPAPHPPTSGLLGTGPAAGDAGANHTVGTHDAGDATASPGGRDAALADASAGDAALADASAGDAALADASAGDAPAGEPTECPRDTPASCPSPEPTYAQASPLLSTYCAACHQPGRTPPDITTYDTAFGAQRSILTTLTGCTMPSPWPTTKERELLLAWLVCGAPP